MAGKKKKKTLPIAEIDPMAVAVDVALVTVLGAIAVQCGQCRYCRSGEFMFCPNRRGMGHGVNGAFARYAVARPDQLFAVPESVPTEHAALVEPLAAAVHGERVLVELEIAHLQHPLGPVPAPARDHDLQPVRHAGGGGTPRP